MAASPAIIAALPREVSALVRGWREHRLPGKVFAYTRDGDDAVVACAGMGAERVTLAVQAARSLKPVTELLSVGLAGACNPKLLVGEIVHAGVVVDARSGERYGGEQGGRVLVTSSEIAGIAEKKRLFASYAADAVDMEAATVARLAQGHGLGFQAIKVISDEAGFEMKELGRFASNDGQFRAGAFAAYAMVRPAMWSRLIALSGNSKRALEALTVELEARLDLYRKKEG